MSHLLYLHSFAVDRFVSVFGRGDDATVDRLLRAVPKSLIRLPPEQARALVVKAVRQGLDGAPRSTDEQILLDALVDAAVTSRSFGVAATPISPMGTGGPVLDHVEARFADAGDTAEKLFEILQRGRNYEGGIVLLSPDDVRVAAKLLRSIADAQDPDDADDLDEIFVEELVEPFGVAAKKGRAVFGTWN